MSTLASSLICHRVFCSFLLHTPHYLAHILPGSTDVCYHRQLSMGSRDPNSDPDTCLARALFTEPSFKWKVWHFNMAKPIRIRTVQKSVSFPLGDSSSFCFHGQPLLPHAWEPFMKRLCMYEFYSLVLPNFNTTPGCPYWHHLANLFISFHSSLQTSHSGSLSAQIWVTL